MFWLILGILIWTLVHFFPSLMPDKRTELIDRLGTRYMMYFAGLIVFSLLLIIIGWRSADPTWIYTPSGLGQFLALFFILAAIILFGAAHAQSRIKQYVRHPMLAGVMLWSIGHLLANGDSRSIVLFLGLGLWAGLSEVFINRRDGEWEKPDTVIPMEKELKVMGISIAVYIVLVLIHPIFSGVSLLA